MRVLQLGAAVGAVGGGNEHTAGRQDAGRLCGRDPRVRNVVQHVTSKDSCNRAAPERQARRVEAGHPDRAGGPATLDDRLELPERQITPHDAVVVEDCRTHRQQGLAQPAPNIKDRCPGCEGAGDLLQTGEGA